MFISDCFVFLAILATLTALRLRVSDVGLWKPLMGRIWFLWSRGATGIRVFEVCDARRFAGPSSEVHCNWVSGELEWPVPRALVPSEIWNFHETFCSGNTATVIVINKWTHFTTCFLPVCKSSTYPCALKGLLSSTCTLICSVWILQDTTHGHLRHMSRHKGHNC